MAQIILNFFDTQSVITNVTTLYIKFFDIQSVVTNVMTLYLSAA